MNTTRSLPEIRIVCQAFHPSHQAMAIRVTHVADALIEAGFPISVLTSKEPDPEPRYHIHHLITPRASNRDGVYLRLLKEVLTSIEVFIRVFFGPRVLYFISSPPFTLTSAAAIACRLRGLRYVFDVRDEYPDVYFSEGLVSEDGWIGRSLRRREIRNYKNAFLVTTVTQQILEKLEARAAGRTSVKLLRNGYSATIPWVEGYVTSPFTLLFHGNMGKFQSPETIVRLAERCTEEKLPIQFHVYGWGAEMDVIKDAAGRLDQLTFLGEVDHDEIPRIIAQATMGMSFQGNSEISKNSFPSKVMEFIGSGIPPMISPISEAGHFVEEHGIGHQFAPDDIDGMVRVLRTYHQDPSRLAEMRKRMASIRGKLSRTAISAEFAEDLASTITNEKTR